MNHLESTEFLPGLSREAEEQECIALALTAAKRHLQEGTATSQEITYFLKLGSMKEQLEMRKIEQEIEVAKAKIANMEAAKHADEMFEKAIAAMKGYGGIRD